MINRCGDPLCPEEHGDEKFMSDDFGYANRQAGHPKRSRLYPLAALVAVIALVVAGIVWVAADAAHARGNACVHGAEARATLVGEGHRHLMQRLGHPTPLVHTRNIRDYEGCDSIRQRTHGHVLRVRWAHLTPHRPNLLQVAGWKWLNCKAHSECAVVDHSRGAAS